MVGPANPIAPDYLALLSDARVTNMATKHLHGL